MELAQLGTTFVSIKSLRGVDGYVVPFVSNLADDHERTGNCIDLEHRKQVMLIISEVQ